jgi:outer membrane protein assembly factor BamA
MYPPLPSYSFVLGLAIIFLASLSQAQVDSSKKIPVEIALPFAIADEKKLSEEDLANKKEGVYLTGAPDFSSDPINGFGYGVEGSIYFNGKRSDPFFAYTPYRRKLDVVLFNTTRNQREFKLTLDEPYIFNSKWRLRVEAAYEVNPNLLYFGNTEASLAPLAYFPNGDSTQHPVSNSSYKEYDKALTGDNENYNRYTKEEYIFNISAEHSFWDSKLRLLGGYELAYLNMTPFSGNSLLRNDYEAGKIRGVYSGQVSILQAGIVYDTRDLEPDPGKGIFAEITEEFSAKAIGSKYDFNKVFGQLKVYQKLFPGLFKKVVLAARFGMGYTGGDSPFFEYQDEWSSEGSIEGLGGSNTLRGYKQSRFLARAMNFGNIELRARFAQAKLFKQHLAFSGVPFFDIGGVWDSLNRLDRWDNYRHSEGMGLRIAWNVSTILRFDYAVSKEDKQFFFSFGQAF